MGIDIPEQYGGQGGTFFQSILAIEELAAVDPSIGVIVDVQNTLFSNAILRWGTEEQKRRYLPRTRRRGRGLVRAVGSRLRFRCVRHGHTRPARRRRWVLTGRKLWITNAAEAGLFLLFANANPEPGYKGITCFLSSGTLPGFQVGKKEDKLGIRASSTCELILDNCRVPPRMCSAKWERDTRSRSKRSTKAGSASAPRCLALRAARSTMPGVCQAAQAIRQNHRRIPGRSVRTRRDGDASRSYPTAGLQRRPAARCRTSRF